MSKNLVYFGSPEFSAQILESIISSKLVNVVGAVTTPDKPHGRKQIMTPSPLALLSEKYDLPVYKPAKLDEANLAHLKLLHPDIFLVVSYGKIIPRSWLETPTLGTFNVHFSLLPKYRGALCISESLKNQDEFTGVTLMEMDEQLDHGAIISQTKVTIDLDDDVATLTTKLTQATETLLEQKLPEICAQNYSKTTQNESLATFTPSHKTLTHSSAFIPWTDIAPCLDKSSLRGAERQLAPASRRGGNLPVRQAGLTPRETHALIRSLNPEPGAWTTISQQPNQLRHSGPDPESIQIKLLQTSLFGDKLKIDLVQIPGKQPISWKQYLSGHPQLNR